MEINQIPETRINLAKTKASTKSTKVAKINKTRNVAKEPTQGQNEHEEIKQPGRGNNYSGKNKPKGSGKRGSKGLATPEEDKRKKNSDKGGGIRTQNSGKSNKSKQSADFSAGKPKGGAPHPKHAGSASKPKPKTFQKDT